MLIKLPLPLPLLLLAGLLVAAPAARGQGPGKVLDKEKVRFDQKLGAQVPLDLPFRDEAGRTVRLRDLVGKGGRPAILSLVYYRCPLLCTLELTGLARSLKPLSLDVGKDFDVVTVSFNPEETPELAAAKKSAYLKRYNRPGAERGWHFLTGDAESIRQLADSVGFRYTYNPKTKLYAHASGLVILTPEGRVARYYFGVDYSAKELQYDLKAASTGKIGSPIRKLLLLCYDYDAATGKYTLSIVRLTRVLGTATALALATFLIVMFRRDRRAAAGRLGAPSASGSLALPPR